MMSQNADGKLIAFPGADRPGDAIRHIESFLADDVIGSECNAIVVVFVFKNGQMDKRCFGHLKISDLAMLGSLLQKVAVEQHRGDDEP
jgi:hypothetical protein